MKFTLPSSAFHPSPTLLPTVGAAVCGIAALACGITLVVHVPTSEAESPVAPSISESAPPASTTEPAAPPPPPPPVETTQATTTPPPTPETPRPLPPAPPPPTRTTNVFNF